jgi:hypothetical protein
VGETCFQPILIFEATSGKPVLAMLRPGKRPSGLLRAVPSADSLLRTT